MPIFEAKSDWFIFNVFLTSLRRLFIILLDIKNIGKRIKIQEILSGKDKAS